MIKIRRSLRWIAPIIFKLCEDVPQTLSRVNPKNSKVVATCVRKTNKEKKKKQALYSSVNVFSTNVQIQDTIFTSPALDRTTILRGRPSQTKA